MKSLSKKNYKLLIVFMSLAVSMFGFSSMDKNNVNASVVIDDIVPAEPHGQGSEIGLNMLNIDTAIITDVRVESVSEDASGITMKFSNLPNISEKIFAVLVDEAAGGVIQSKYLDGSNSVTFDIMPDSIKVPGVHLYKQGANDEPFLLRRENFIASTSHMMNSTRNVIDISGYTKSVSALDGNGNIITAEEIPSKAAVQPTVPKGVLTCLPSENVFSFDFSLTTLNYIEGISGLDAPDILAVVIAEDENGNTLDVRQWVATQYKVSVPIKGSVSESSQRTTDCKFDFMLPSAAKKVKIHLYKHGLFKENFLCKYEIDSISQGAHIR